MTKLEALQQTYAVLYGKIPPNPYKNDVKWLESKIKDASSSNTKQIEAVVKQQQSFKKDTDQMIKKLQQDNKADQQKGMKQLTSVINESASNAQLQSLQDTYHALFGVKPSLRYKNNIPWLQRQIEEKRNQTIANSVVSTLEKKRELENALNETPSKKVKTEVTFADLMNKATPYEEWFKFNKLKATATDEDKELFVKKAEGKNQGKESYFSLTNIKKRVEDLKENSDVSHKKVNGLFANQSFRKKIKYVLTVLNDLHVDETHGDVINKGINIDFMPIVFETFAQHLMDKSKQFKSELLLSKIETFVDDFNTEQNESEVEKLKKEIKQLKEDLSDLPEKERFAKMREDIKTELREKEKLLLNLEEGTEEARGLDLMDGVSQMY